MATLSDNAIESLVSPYLQAPISGVSGGAATATQASVEMLIPALSTYLDLLLRWNERTNLTAIRNPEQIVQRHFGESLFAARVLACKLNDGSTVLDIGSGAGFPGMLIQLFLKRLKVTLAESQGKKSAFLREVVREMGVKAEVWQARAQDLPASRLFHAVTMRAVDKPQQAVAEGYKRLTPGGYMLCFSAERQGGGETVDVPGLDASAIQLTQGAHLIKWAPSVCV